MEKLEEIAKKITSERLKLWCYGIDKENLMYRADEYVKRNYNQNGKRKLK